MAMQADELRRALAEKSDEEVRRLLFNICWNFFGEVDDELADVINPGLTPGPDDLKCAVEGLRQDLFGR
jgi:hypothetical protein